MTYLDADAALIRRSVPEGTSIPEDSDDLFILYAVLMRAKGRHIEATDVHDAWSAWMRHREPDHSSLVPYDQLPAAIQTEDAPFLAAIRRAATNRRE